MTGGIVTRQVSARGGDLRVAVDKSEGLVKLAGEVKVVSTGQLYL